MTTVTLHADAAVMTCPSPGPSNSDTGGPAAWRSRRRRTPRGPLTGMNSRNDSSTTTQCRSVHCPTKSKWRALHRSFGCQTQSQPPWDSSLGVLEIRACTAAMLLASRSGQRTRSSGTRCSSTCPVSSVEDWGLALDALLGWRAYEARQAGNELRRLLPEYRTAHQDGDERVARSRAEDVNFQADRLYDAAHDPVWRLIAALPVLAGTVPKLETRVRFPSPDSRRPLPSPRRCWASRRAAARTLSGSP